MKAKFLSLIAGMAMIVAGLAFTSCGDDDDDSHKITSQTISFKCEANDILLEIANLTVTYTDANGKTQSEPLTGSFSKTITVKKFPAQGEFKVKATQKDDFDLKKVLGKNPKLTYSYVCGNTGISGSQNSIQTMFLYTQSEIAELLEKINSASWKWSITSSGAIIHN